jgi:hypothetical protein
MQAIRLADGFLLFTFAYHLLSGLGVAIDLESTDRCRFGEIPPNSNADTALWAAT